MCRCMGKKRDSLSVFTAQLYKRYYIMTSYVYIYPHEERGAEVWRVEVVTDLAFVKIYLDAVEGKEDRNVSSSGSFVMN